MLPYVSQAADSGQTEAPDILNQDDTAAKIDTVVANETDGAESKRGKKREHRRVAPRARGGGEPDPRLGEARASKRNQRKSQPKPRKDDPSVQLAEVQHKLEMLSGEHENMKELLRVRGDELQGLRAYLDTSDKVSMEDVRRMVEQLNAEIFQLSVSVASSCQYHEDTSAMSGGVDGTQNTACVKGVLGKRLFGILKGAKHNQDPYCVQIALQAYLTAYVANLSKDWSTSGGEQMCFVQTAYEKLKNSGESRQRSRYACLL